MSVDSLRRREGFLKLGLQSAEFSAAGFCKAILTKPFRVGHNWKQDSGVGDFQP